MNSGMGLSVANVCIDDLFLISSFEIQKVADRMLPPYE